MSAGLARSTAFNIGSATVMLGPQNALWDLRPDQHSIGLVKNFSISNEPNVVDLTQGSRNTTVYSVLTQNKVMAQCEVFEYSSRNLNYALGLDGISFVAFPNEYLTAAALTGNDGSPVVVLTFVNATNVTAEFPVGAWISLQNPAAPDATHYGKVSATTTVTGSAPNITHTVTFTGFGLKTGNNFPAGSLVQRVNQVRVGSVEAQPFFACKVVGILPEKNEPITVLMPKVRIMKGFSLAFNTEQFNNMPFQLQPYDLVGSDPFYADFQTVGSAMLMTAT